VLREDDTVSRGAALRSAWSAAARLVAGGAVVALLTAGMFAPPQAVLAVDVPSEVSTSSVTVTEATGSVAQAASDIESASVTASGSVTPSGSVPPSGTVDTSKTPPASTTATTAVFARMRGFSLKIHLPAPPKKFVAVGFHQADNKKAILFVPLLKCHGRDKASKTKALIKKGKVKLFQQPLRGRGDSNFTAADCAVRPKTVVVAPVDGVVTNVRHYTLYGHIYDLRLEIKPDGATHLRVVMIHITGVKVKKGQRVVGGVTPVAVVRHLPISSTINRFVPVKPVDHVHIQVNKDTFKGSY
jgi:hypothetical protein